MYSEVLRRWKRDHVCYVQKETGVSGFVLKGAPVEVLAAAIRKCADGEEVIDPALAARALEGGACPSVKATPNATNR